MYDLKVWPVVSYGRPIPSNATIEISKPSLYSIIQKFLIELFDLFTRNLQDRLHICEEHHIWNGWVESTRVEWSRIKENRLKCSKSTSWTLLVPSTLIYEAFSSSRTVVFLVPEDDDLNIRCSDAPLSRVTPLLWSLPDGTSQRLRAFYNLQGLFNVYVEMIGRPDEKRNQFCFVRGCNVVSEWVFDLSVADHVEPPSNTQIQTSDSHVLGSDDTFHPN